MNPSVIANNVVFISRLILGGGAAIFGALALIAAIRGQKKASEVLATIALVGLGGLLLFAIVGLFIGGTGINGDFFTQFLTQPIAPAGAAPTPVPAP